MTLIAYIDNEVPNFGEWDAIVAGGDSAVTQSADAAFPERGELGLRVQTESDSAYGEKVLPSQRRDLSIAFWLCISSRPSWSWGMTDADICRATGDGGIAMRLCLSSYDDAERLELRLATDGGETAVIDNVPLTPGRWYYVAAVCHWSDDACNGQLFLDGALRGQCSSSCGGTSRRPESVRIGFIRDDYVCPAVLDFDEVKLAEQYSEPFRTPPADETCQLARTLLAFNQSSAHSRSVANHCVETLGIPRGNLCPLPNASASETLADYAAFQSQVEDDLKAWLARNPTAAERCMCIILGYALPGYFVSDGVTYSATSRLMDLNRQFSPGKANPLYKPDTVARPGKADLDGLYLVSRIDADGLIRANELVNRAASILSLNRLESENVLYCDDSEYRCSVASQKLRLPSADIATLDSDGFTWGLLTDPQFGPGGQRVAFAATSDASASTLRSTGSACAKALLNGGYAAALGSCDDADDFDPEGFFEMLRIGGTFAEAVAVATARLNYTSVAVGAATLAVAFPQAGLNVYHGAGGADAIDYSEPVACLRAGQTTAEISLELAPGEKHYLAARAVSEYGVEETNTHVIASAGADAGGNLLPPPLPTPHEVTADVVDTSSVVVGFSCSPEAGEAGPSAFEVLSDNGTGVLDTETPIATVTARPGRCDYLAVATADCLPAKFAVRATLGEQSGDISRTVSAYCATVAAPNLLQVETC